MSNSGPHLANHNKYIDAGGFNLIGIRVSIMILTAVMAAPALKALRTPHLSAIKPKPSRPISVEIKDPDLNTMALPE
ncbi:hypothetical protein HZA56_02020 [Candidatus Poribacteria bacterium]|nr:hypothetical protein [Candidatus Poribacteria bacterium]